MTSSYQPFLIGQGKSSTGLFSYLESWVKPEDAFDELINAYVYRGSIYQRQGMVLFPSASGNGALVYQNNEISATGNGGSGLYSGTLTNRPLIGTVTITALTSSGIRSSTAAFAPGTVPWSTGGSSLATAGGINFSTGFWQIMTSANVGAGIPIVVQYNFVPTAITSGGGAGSINNPIMGIKTHINDTTNVKTLVVIDTRRASRWDPNTKAFVPIQSFQQFTFEFPLSNARVTTGSIITQWTNLAPYTLSVTVFNPDGSVFDSSTDIPESTTRGHWAAGVNGHIDTTASVIHYDDGHIEVHFNSAPPDFSTVQITASLQGDYFTGDNTNFFNSVNWRTADRQPAYLYLTNNVDPVTLFDGTNLARPPFVITATNSSGAIVNFTTGAGGALLYPILLAGSTGIQVSKTLDVKVYKNRLLFLRPTIFGNTTPEPQSIFFSAIANQLNPLGNFNFAQDIAGNGGFVEVPTGDWLMAAQLLRDGIILFFQTSTWFFRFTGAIQDPFRVDQLNNSKNTDAPYGSVAYDIHATSMGSKGLIECNGVSVERYDLSVIDQFLDINQNAFGQCFATKFDTLNQTWMLFPSEESDNGTSDSVLVYNFLERTWAVYQPNLGLLVQDNTKNNTLSCTGLAFTTKDLTWADFASGGFFGASGLNWSQATFPWNSYLEQDLAPELLAGDQNGFVYTVNEGPTDNPGPASPGSSNGIQTFIQTKRFNPFAPSGMKARFGYFDLYYEVNPAITITIKFYNNNSTVPTQFFTFNLDSPLTGPSSDKTSETWAWKRFYPNLVGEFLQIEINSQIGGTDDDPVYNTAGVFKILGMILWAAPAGRLTPGSFI